MSTLTIVGAGIRPAQLANLPKVKRLAGDTTVAEVEILNGDLQGNLIFFVGQNLGYATTQALPVAGTITRISFGVPVPDDTQATIVLVIKDFSIDAASLVGMLNLRTLLFSGDDLLNGGLFPDELVGGQGDDTVYGYAGDDLLRGGAGDDLIGGGFGDDALFGGAGDDTLAGGFGVNVLRGGNGDDVLVLAAAALTAGDFIDGGNGRDTVQISSSTSFSVENVEAVRFKAGLTLSIEWDQLLALDSVVLDFVPQQSGRATFRISDSDQSIFNLDAFELSGKGGSAVGYEFFTRNIGGALSIFGRTASFANDHIVVDDSFAEKFAVVVDGRGGDDFIQANTTAGTFSNTVDMLSGGAGNDTVIGDEFDIVNGGGSSMDSLVGGDGNDLLMGMGNMDTLRGGAGNDTLVGGVLFDVLEGGTGSDLFVLDLKAYTFGEIFDDQIVDFKAAEGDRFGTSIAFTSVASRAAAPTTPLNTIRYEIENGFTTLYFGLDNDSLFDFEFSFASSAIPQLSWFVVV